MKHTCFVSLTFFFRDEFLLLKKHMFDKLKVPQRSYLKVSVLFMTATANMAILKRLSGITGLTFKPQPRLLASRPGHA